MHAAGGMLTFLLVVLVVAFFNDSGIKGSVSAAVAAGVFIFMIFASTSTAYEQGKKDALVERRDQEPSS